MKDTQAAWQYPQSNKPAPGAPHCLAQHKKPPQSTQIRLASWLSPYIFLLPPPGTWDFHAISKGTMDLHSSMLGAFPQSLECSSSLSFKILIILKGQLKCRLFSKTNPNSNSKRIALFLASYLYLVSMPGISFCLAVNCFIICPRHPTPHPPVRHLSGTLSWTLIGTREMLC